MKYLVAITKKIVLSDFQKQICIAVSDCDCGVTVIREAYTELIAWSDAEKRHENYVKDERNGEEA